MKTLHIFIKIKTETTIALSTITWENTYHSHVGWYTTQPTSPTTDKTLQPLEKDESNPLDHWRESWQCLRRGILQPQKRGEHRPVLHLRFLSAAESPGPLVNHRLLAPTLEFPIQLAWCGENLLFSPSSEVVSSSCPGAAP